MFVGVDYIEPVNQELAPLGDLLLYLLLVFVLEGSDFLHVFVFLQDDLLLLAEFVQCGAEIILTLRHDGQYFVSLKSVVKVQAFYDEVFLVYLHKVLDILLGVVVLDLPHNPHSHLHIAIQVFQQSLIYALISEPIFLHFSVSLLNIGLVDGKILHFLGELVDRVLYLLPFFFL